MPKYTVLTEVTYLDNIEVEADSAEEARAKVLDPDFDITNIDHDHDPTLNVVAVDEID